MHMYAGTLPTRPPTLFEIQRRADRLVAAADAQVKAIIGRLSPDEDFVGVLFDESDLDGMTIYRELGFVEKDPTSTIIVMDLLLSPLMESLRKHEYQPLDEEGWEEGTVLLYVFTMRAVVVRRFATGAELRAVRRSRDIEFVDSPRVQARQAIDFIVESCRSALIQLDRSGDRVAVIQEADHGAKVSYFARDAAVSALRAPASHTPTDIQEACRTFADRLAAPTPDKIDCVISGWRSTQLLRLNPSFLKSDASGSAAEKRDESVELAAVCRDQKRVIGLLKKRLEKMPASIVKPLLAELVSVVRDNWQDCDGILAKAAVVTDAAATGSDDVRLREALIALSLATAERKSGALRPTPRVTSPAREYDYTVEPGTHSGLVIAPRTHRRPPNLPLTTDDAKLRLGQLIKSLERSVGEAVRKLDDQGLGASWAAVLFDSSDEQGMKVYRRLGPNWEALPKGAAIVVSCALDRLDKELVASGYPDLPNRWGEVDPGCVRIVGLSLGLVIVTPARAIEMVRPGMA
jgi:hypothetical protein